MRKTKQQRRRHRQQLYEQNRNRRKLKREIDQFMQQLMPQPVESDPGPAVSPLALPRSRYRQPPRWPDADMMQTLQRYFERDAASQEGD